MRFTAQLTTQTDGTYMAKTVTDPLCVALGKTRDEVLTNLEEEIRYRLEFCPCAFLRDNVIQLDVIE